MDNPRDRLVYSEARGFNVFQSLGHWLWIMAGRMDLESIKFYDENAARFSTDGQKLTGAYGPRLFGIGVLGQIPRIIELIRQRKNTRRAVAVVFLPEFDAERKTVNGREDEVPCTVSLQFLPRNGVLHAIAYMRSQEALRLLPHDVFVFTLLQEYVAACTGLNLGTYRHFTGSIHVYEQERKRAEAVLAEVPTSYPLMPWMERTDQNALLRRALALEERIRVNAASLLDPPGRRKSDANTFLREAENLPSFWKVVVQGLVAWAAYRLREQDTLRKVVKSIDSSWGPFAQRTLAKDSEQRLLSSYDFRVTR